MKRKKCYIYTRVSTVAQVEGYSLDAQAERLREYAVYKDLEIAAEYCDAGKSGKSIKGRPEFQQMLDDIVAQKDDISFVLVFKLSRFGRNAADVLKSMQLLADYEINLVCVEDAIDSSTQGGRLTLAILSAVAEIERENINIQFAAGRMQKLSEGGWPGGPVPYGYRNENKKLVIVPEEAEVVKKIYDLYEKDGLMLTSVAAYLNEHGYKRIINGEARAFTFDSVKIILDNPIYCGKILFNRRIGNKTPNGETKKVITVDGIHEPIVSQEQWEVVQKKRKQYSKKREKPESPERISLLSGLIKCPICGTGMIRKKCKNINHNKGGYYKIRYNYACSNHRKSNGRICDFNHIYVQEKVDNAVLEIINNLTMTPQFQEKVIRNLCDHDTENSLEKELQLQQKQLRSGEIKVRKLGENLDYLDIFDEHYDEEYDRIQSEIDSVYDEIERIEIEIGQKRNKLLAVKKGLQSADQITTLLNHMKLFYEHMSCEERRRMYRLFIKKIEVYPEHPEGKIIKSISFKFPIFYGGEPVSENCVPDEEIGFTLDCEDLELTAAEAKATYAQIRQYILDKCGVKVSSLYIAQIKRKYGLELMENYNKPKNPDTRVPQCPKTKEKIIMDALKHYRMLDENVEMMA